MAIIRVDNRVDKLKIVENNEKYFSYYPTKTFRASPAYSSTKKRTPQYKHKKTVPRVGTA